MAGCKATWISFLLHEKWLSVSLAVILFLILGVTPGKGLSRLRHSEDEDSSSRTQMELPSIQTQGKLHRVQVGDTLTLPCDVRNLGPMVLLWKKGHRVLTAGRVTVRRDRRIALMGNNLQIAAMNIHDGGEYVCEIEADADDPIAIVHTVEILVPPSIMSEPRSGNVTVRKGTTVSLECKANGNPTPTVSWTRISHKRHRSIPDKDLTNHGMILTLDNVGRRDAGKYQCTATNGVGKDAVKYIHVSVLYKPVVVVHDASVQGGENRPATLTCTIHADPPANVAWYKNTLLIGNSPGYQFNVQGDHHSLVIANVGIEDFANYSCLAMNNMGKEEGIIQLRGNPDTPILDPNVRMLTDSSWKLSWITKSFANITEYRLLYRKVPDDGNPPDTTYAWNNVILPRQNTVGGFEQYQSYDIQHLSPGSKYEVQVQAKNNFGWSQRSESLRFSTEVHKVAEPPSVYTTPHYYHPIASVTSWPDLPNESNKQQAVSRNAMFQEYGLSEAGISLGGLGRSCSLVLTLIFVVATHYSSSVWL